MSLRTVLITGGASGMGLATARRFAGAGHRVVIGDRDRAALDAAVATLGAGPGLLAVPVDVASPPACEALVERTIAAFGRLDVLVNCAGVWLEGPAEHVTEVDFDRVFAVNLKGTFFVCRTAIPHLVSSGGSIVNLASDAGLVGNAGASVYSASKGGVVLLSRALALELAPRGVRVNAVCPCDVATPMIEFQAAAYGGGDPGRYKADLLARYPQKGRARFATPEEIAEFIYYLASELAAPITGAAIPIDFGLTAGY